MIPSVQSTVLEEAVSEGRIVIEGEGSIVEVERGKIYRIRLRLPPAKPGGPRKWSKQRTVRGNTFCFYDFTHSWQIFFILKIRFIFIS